MKKVLSILGIVFLIFIVAFGCFVGYAAMTGSKLDSSSKAFVDGSIPVITGSWSGDELLSRASPEFKQAVDAQPEQFQMLFQKLSKLGALKHYEGSKGQATIFVDAAKGKVITANYTAEATFEQGNAHFMLHLIQRDGQWQYLGFRVDSPIFLQ